MNNKTKHTGPGGKLDYHNPAGMKLTLLRVPPQLDNTEKIKALTQSFAIYKSIFCKFSNSKKSNKLPKGSDPRNESLIPYHLNDLAEISLRNSRIYIWSFKTS